MTCDVKLVTCGSSSWCEACGAEWDTGDESIPCRAGTAVGRAFARGVEVGMRRAVAGIQAKARALAGTAESWRKLGKTDDKLGWMTEREEALTEMADELERAGP